MKTLKDLFDVRTCGFIGGMILVTAGLTLVYVPAALIVPGAALAGLSVWGAK
ncbi:MAG: hypothetical protein M3P06_11345 [Acidobacteriota bacterium]|nr:hypothetical protein [Acidobacteriota bacterium]